MGICFGSRLNFKYLWGSLMFLIFYLVNSTCWVKAYVIRVPLLPLVEKTGLSLALSKH